jgi:PhnB protein
MIQLNPYLNFTGNTEEAFNFYRSVFGGEFQALMRFGEMPGGEKMQAADARKIMHVALPIGEHNILMGTDILESLNQTLTQGDSISISITIDSEDQIRHLFTGLSKDGTVLMPLGKESWGDLFGMLRDKFGVQWLLNYKK